MWKIVVGILSQMSPFLWFTTIVGGVWTIVKQHDAERSRKETEKELESVKQQLNDKSHISQKRFDLELEVYKDLSKSLVAAYDSSSLLQPIMDSLPEKPEEQLEVMKHREKDFVQAFNDFSRVRRENAPFYSENISKKLESISKDMNELHNLFTYKWFIPEMKAHAVGMNGMQRNLDLHESIKNETNQITTEIRGRLDKLSDQA
ncbi:hypothetical protein [Levilactobacillus yiduensis]|uniref:hypothetical protein n=1 Tax=Levilactobacillus yiduensis TaxID=2953880 RepID=UPI000EF2ECDC|nr:hypothetical protein [Levilactobacillus yiduensis]AYM03686.1 hypothetical protein D8911_12085 [Levilactobacillus brevis]